MMLQSSGVRSCEKAISTKRASIAISGSAGNQRGNKGVPIAGDEFAKTKKGLNMRSVYSEGAELDYPSKREEGWREQVSQKNCQKNSKEKRMR